MNELEWVVHAVKFLSKNIKKQKVTARIKKTWQILKDFGDSGTHLRSNNDVCPPGAYMYAPCMPPSTTALDKPTLCVREPMEFSFLLPPGGGRGCWQRTSRRLGRSWPSQSRPSRSRRSVTNSRNAQLFANKLQWKFFKVSFMRNARRYVSFSWRSCESRFVGESTVASEHDIVARSAMYVGSG